MSATDSLPTPSATPPVLWPLLFGNFVIGTGVMVVPGTLNEISSSMGVSVPVVGQLIAAAAAVMCLGAPLLAAVVAGWDRRRLLTITMLWYALFMGLCALMPSFGWLLGMRVLAVVAPAIFTPQAAACVGLLVLQEHRGRAITFVFLGWSLASVLGMPLGAWMGGTLGWRSAFWLVVVLSVLSAAWLWRTMPDGVRPPALSRAAWGQALRSKALMFTVGVTLLLSVGQFVLFSYFAPYFKETMQITPVQLGLLFAWFGVFGFIGNMVMARKIDHLGAGRSVALGGMGIALSLLLWPLGSSLLLVAVILVPWALGCFSTNSAQQARLVGLAPALATGSIALNTSAMYAGQALGASGGGWLIANGHMGSLHWFGLLGILAALGLSALTSSKPLQNQ